MIERRTGNNRFSNSLRLNVGRAIKAARDMNYNWTSSQISVPDFFQHAMVCGT